MNDFLENWTALSNEGIIGSIFDLLGSAADWADAVAELLGLV
ncbi:PorA family porin [Corynebacterium pacaense]|nr:PorA family porin [Corynebacterium pacaense]